MTQVLHNRIEGFEDPFLDDVAPATLTKAEELAEETQSTKPRTHHSHILLDERPLMIPPTLAAVVGLNEAIILQQVHYWINQQEHLHDGRYWVWHSYSTWTSNFPFFSAKQIRTAIERLEKMGVLLTGCYNRDKRDRTKWYSIDYNVLDELAAKIEPTLQAIREKAEYEKQRHNAQRMREKGWVYLGDEIEDYEPPLPTW